MLLLVLLCTLCMAIEWQEKGIVRLGQQLLALLCLEFAPLRRGLCMRGRHELVRQGQGHARSYGSCQQGAADGLQRLALLLLLLGLRTVPRGCL